VRLGGDLTEVANLRSVSNIMVQQLHPVVAIRRTALPRHTRLAEHVSIRLEKPGIPGAYGRCLVLFVCLSRLGSAEQRTPVHQLQSNFGVLCSVDDCVGHPVRLLVHLVLQVMPVLLVLRVISWISIAVQPSGTASNGPMQHADR
jgi:hypothetical protein